MRFNETVFYSINDLKLDEENYRFGLAKNQQECIDLIYKDSPESFENLLNDIINNNIGDYPLVFINANNENIVLDGNRRVSVLKIINDPSLAPTKKLTEYLNSIDKDKLPFDLDKIGCFVSRDKQEILKTVYERHAAGRGISRIQWSAFATAKFRYDAEIEDNDWRAISILLHLISIDEPANELIKKSNFSFEVFRRMIRHAYQNGYLHYEIFNEDKNVIIPDSEYLAKGLDLVRKIIKVIDNGEVGLSRGKNNYASDDYLTQYFTHHFIKMTEIKPPRKKRRPKVSKITKPTSEPISAIEEPSNSNIEIGTNTSEPEQNLTIESPVNIPSPPPQMSLPLSGSTPILNIIEPPTLIDTNHQLIHALNKLSVQKFNLLYQSISQLNIKKHAILAVVATWAFLDSLPRVAGWTGTDFTSYYNNYIKNLIPPKESQADIRHSISWIFSEGNCNKHSSQYVTLDHKEFIKHFNNIQYFIAKIIEEKIIPEKNGVHG
ncbi:hypothetical protein HXZ65_12475 [Acinetobacter indicus]|uniref:hypothetical protein n=1 Tax=Acinetobacter indicus TaxID=756892 RepID=UPI002574AAEB|nr:hypothetical protein [Acinetobacter indicus]MDM1279058.1 hypothetical protein [Acinetobacter indicus]